MKTFSSWLQEIFPFKVQKISIDAGFTCPNRDGNISTDGCTFCDNSTFSPAYCRLTNQSSPCVPSITEQIKTGKDFFARKYPKMKYLAYFQSFSNTYAPLSKLKAIYEEALAQPDIVGLVIGTRPDCISSPILDYLAELSKKTFILVEYGVESVNDKTLRRVNRGHSFACSLTAIEETAKRGIYVGVHIIIGLPGDNIDDTIQGIKLLHTAGMKLLKLHQLQIIRGTRMAEEYTKTQQSRLSSQEDPFPLYTCDEYINIIHKVLKALPADVIYDRFVSQSPPEKVIAPNWGLKNHEFTNKLNQILKQTENLQNN